MDAKLAKKLVDYVDANPGKTKAEIEAAIPGLSSANGWVEFATEDANPKVGFILKSDGGKFTLGPNADLIF